MKTKNRTAVITGANRGIGFECARQLLDAGVAVILTARERASGESACEQLNQRRPGMARFVAMDVTDPESVRGAAAQVLEMAPSIDILINNAGILEDWDASILDTDERFLHNAFDTNALGPLRVTRALLPGLRSAPNARVINVSSAAGQLSTMRDWAPSYGVSKAALNAITVQLATALKSDSIAVNAVSPGWVRTEMGGEQAPRSIEEGASGIVWLATEAPTDLTGAFLRDQERLDW